MKSQKISNRRKFLKNGLTLTTGIGVVLLPGSAWSDVVPVESIHIIGPKEGFSPQIGTLVSMLNWMRMVILQPVQGLSTEQLDYLHDDKSNSIGSMLFHLAATERFYQIHTFEKKKWGEWDEKDKQKFSVAMSLGEEARKTIKGNDLNFYLDKLKDVRENTLVQLKKRTDKWLTETDNFFGGQPTNNYCKWFHVCEHESNHNGQIKWIKSRLPGATGTGD